MPIIIGRIEYEILPWRVIPKPQTYGEHRVMGWGVRRCERALIHTIPNRRTPSRPYAKA